MDISVIIKQMELFATMIVLGYSVYKFKIVNDEGVRGFSQVLTRFIIPCMLISMMPNGGGVAEIKSSGRFILVSVIYISAMFLVSHFISMILIPENRRRRMHTLVSSMGNAGFLGSPLCAVVFPSQSIVNALYVVIEALFCWILGPIVVDENMRFNKDTLKNLKTPIMTAIFLGFIMVFLNIHPKGFVPWDTVTAIGGTTKYFATFYIGMSLGQIGIMSLFRDMRILVSSLCKLIIYPLALTFVLKHLQILEGDCLGLMIIMACTPTGMAAPMVAEVAHGDKEYAIAGTMINTILCLFTIPVVSYLSTFV